MAKVKERDELAPAVGDDAITTPAEQVEATQTAELTTTEAIRLELSRLSKAENEFLFSSFSGMIEQAKRNDAIKTALPTLMWNVLSDMMKSKEVLK